jgi:hypothetical protein
VRRRCEVDGDEHKVWRDRDSRSDTVDGGRDSKMRLGAWMAYTSLESGRQGVEIAQGRAG